MSNVVAWVREGRSAAAVPAAAGLLLVLLVMRLHALLTIEQIRASYPLLYLGTAVFVLGLLQFLQIQLPSWPEPFLRRAAAAFGWVPRQILLLLLAFGYAFAARLAAGDGAYARDFILSLVAWLSASGLAVLATLSPTQGGREKVSRETIDVAWMIGLLLGALLLRAVNLDVIPATLSGDEGSSGLYAVQFLNGATNNLLNLGWFSFPSFYFRVQSLGILWLGQTTAGLRITSAIAGALTVPALYWLVRQLFGRPAAVAAGLLLMVAHYHIHFSRIGLNNIWDGLFAVLVLATLWRGWRSGRRGWFIVSGLLLGLSQYFYVSMRPFPLLILLWSGLAWWKEPVTFKRRLPDLCVTAVVSLIVFIPLALYFLAHLDQFNAPLQRVSIFNGWLTVAIEQTGWPTWRIILDQIRKTAFGITHIPLRSWYTPGTGLLLPPTAVMFVIGLFLLLRRISLAGLLLLVPMAGIILTGAFSQDMPAAQRYIILSPLAVAVCGVAIGEMLSFLRTRFAGERMAPVLAISIFLLALMAYDLNFYFREVPERFVLGGINTEVATAVADYVQPLSRPDLDVYFLGAPRMTFYSHSTIPYLLPEVNGFDILEPLTAPPILPEEEAIFIFLPERFNELQYVQEAKPGGAIEAVNDERGLMLFAVYRVEK